jgi:hypothetical protein
MSPRPQPPLWAWGAAAALAIAVFGLLALCDPLIRPAALAYYLNLERLDQTAPRDAKRVVVLGSSRTGCGLLFDKDMDRLFRDRGAAVRFTRFSLNAANANDLRPVLDRMRLNPPDLVLVESDLVLLRPREHEPDDVGEPLTARVRSHLLWALHVGSRENDSARACAEQFTPTVVAKEVARYRGWVSKRQTSTDAERADIVRPLLDLRDRGARVGLIDLPRSPWARAIQPRRLVERVDDLASRLRQNDHVLMLRPAPPPQSAYLDPHHFNAAGRATYSASFADTVIAALAQPDE